MAQRKLCWCFIVVSIFGTDASISPPNHIRSGDQSSTKNNTFIKNMYESVRASTALTTSNELPKVLENVNTLPNVLEEVTDDPDLKLMEFPRQNLKLNLSNSFCSLLEFDSDELLCQYTVNCWKRYSHSAADDDDLLNVEDVPAAEVTRTNRDKYQSNFTDILPANCSFLEDDVQSEVVICAGQEMRMVPIFRTLRDVDTLVFNKTGIQALDLKSIRGLPRVKELIFSSGILMRVAFNDLLSKQPYMTKLSLVNNSIISLTFSSFFVEPEREILRVLDLRHNLITNLPQAPVNNETVLPNLEVLMLSDNPLGVLPGDIFYPLRKSPVKILNLKNSEISDYSIPSFEDQRSPMAFLPHLDLLDLSQNPLLNKDRLENLLSPFHYLDLKHLILNDNGYLEVPTGALKMVKSSLIGLSLARASFNCLDKFSFPKMPKLKSLNLQYSRISQIKEGSFDSLRSLKCLRLDGNDLITLPPPLMLLSLQVLTLNENPRVKLSLDPVIHMKECSWKYCTHLKLLSMDEVPLKFIESYYFQGLNQLLHLSLNWCSITYIQDGSFKDLMSLQYLNLRNNQLKTISRETFKGLVKMQSLDLSGNKLNFLAVSEDKKKEYVPSIDGILSSFSPLSKSKKESKIPQTKAEGEITTPYIQIDSFHDLDNLRSLNLKGNNINIISDKIFEWFPNLRLLDLSQNKIKRWTIRVFVNNPNLTYLNLRNNALEILTNAMIGDLSKPNMEVDLSGNPLICMCSLHSFVNQLNQTIFVNKENYKCRDTGGTVSIWSYINTSEPCVDKFRISEKSNPRGVDYTIYIVFAFISVVSLSVALVTYRNRWFLKYLVYKLKVHYRGPPSDSEEYEYDVFICYSQADRKWVFETLVSELESSGKMRVCVHERDFLVGEQITNNILRSIKISRKVVVVISQAFVQSSWCMFELQIASNRTLDERKNKLILLILEQVPLKEQPRQIKLLLRTRTYVPWVSDIEGQKIFWSRLLKAIKKPLYNDAQSTDILTQ